MKTALLSSLMVGIMLGCSGPLPDIEIGPMDIFFHHDVVPPDDIDDLIRAMYRCMAPEYPVHQIFDVHLHLVPAYYPVVLREEIGDTQWTVGSYDGYSMTVQVFSHESAIQTALPHELIQHRTPHVLGDRSLNKDHAPQWQITEDAILDCVLNGE